MTRLRAFWEHMRGTYWAVPSAMAAAAVVFSIVMIDLDEALTAQFLSRLSWVYAGGPEGARAVLSTIAASMITVAGVTFSITIVALTLASQQFGPRLLRGFLRDLGNQVTLGTFIATFIYCLLVLRTVRGTDDAQFVPHLAVTVGVVLAMLSLGVLIFFIHHVSTSIQAAHVIANVAADLASAIGRLFPEQIGHGPPVDLDERTSPTALPSFEGAHAVLATAGGYVQAVDSTRLNSLTKEHDLVVRIDARPGTFVRAGTRLASVVPSSVLDERLDQVMRAAFIIGPDRTGTQDLGFFINQLVELAVRALSPGINDPATARTCIDRLEEALCQLAARRMPSPYRYDDDHVLRLIASPVTFASMVDLAFAEIARYGRSSVSVSCRLLDALRDLAPCAKQEEDRLALLRHADVVGLRPDDGFTNALDREELARCHGEAVAALRASKGRTLNVTSSTGWLGTSRPRTHPADRRRCGEPFTPKNGRASRVPGHTRSRVHPGDSLDILPG